MGANVQRDAAVGILAGHLDKAGIYGIEIELFGFIYDDGQRQVLVSDSEMDAAEAAYRHVLCGDALSEMYGRSQRMFGTADDIAREKEKFFEAFRLELRNEKGRAPLQRVQLENRGVISLPPEQCLSGFTYDVEGWREVFVDAYFPQTLRKWLKKLHSGASMGAIVFLEKRRGDLEPLNEQLRQFKTSLLTRS